MRRIRAADYRSFRSSPCGASVDSNPNYNPEKTVLAVSTVSATAATSPASAPPTTAAVAAASAPTATAVAAASPSATTAFALWARLVDDERSSEKILAVQSFNCLVCFRVVADLSKTEAARLPRKPIAKQGE